MRNVIDNPGRIASMVKAALRENDIGPNKADTLRVETRLNQTRVRFVFAENSAGVGAPARDRDATVLEFRLHFDLKQAWIGYVRVSRPLRSLGLGGQTGQGGGTTRPADRHERCERLPVAVGADILGQNGLPAARVPLSCFVKEHLRPGHAN